MGPLGAVSSSGRFGCREMGCGRMRQEKGGGGSNLGPRPRWRMVSCCPVSDRVCVSGSPKLLQPYSPSVRLNNGARRC